VSDFNTMAAVNDAVAVAETVAVATEQKFLNISLAMFDNRNMRTGRRDPNFLVKFKIEGETDPTKKWITVGSAWKHEKATTLNLDIPKLRLLIN